MMKRSQTFLLGVFSTTLLPVAAIAQSTETASPTVQVVRYQPRPELLSAISVLRADVPVVRGFRAPLTMEVFWPHELPDAHSPPEFRAAAALVMSQLACDGLLPTTVRAVDILKLQNHPAMGHRKLLLLRAVGLPVDLYDWFRPPGSASDVTLIDYITTLLAQGRSAESIIPEVMQAAFLPKPTVPGLRLAAEDGRSPVSLVRLQLSRGSYWRALGDGSSVEVARQLVDALDGARVMISTNYEAQAEVIAAAETWASGRKGEIIVVASPWKPEQWAQDNGKPAVVAASDGRREIVTLAPRYASRGEERTRFDPDETFTLVALSTAGLRVVQSPLLFQGGNLLVIEDASGRRTLLVGEAEIMRNTALGLTREQVLGALAVECGVERCLALPAVSFHIDVELCARRHRNQVVILVNDEGAAARGIVSIGTECLSRGGKLNSQIAEKVRAALARGEEAKAVEMIAPEVLKLGEGGTYPESVAELFSRGETDAAVANFERFMLALDILAARNMGAGNLPSDPVTRAYITSLQRRQTERDRMHATLRNEGWRIAAIPSLSDERRGLNYVNGFHVPGRYLMPAYGGVFAELDETAAKAIRSVFDGEVEVVPILCGETQRRLGAIHCAASIYPEG